MTDVVRTVGGQFVVPPKSPGRPAGPTEAELIRRHLAPGKTAVLDKLAELAALGDPRSMELFLRYFSPGARAEDEKFVVPRLAQATTMEDKAEAIVAAVSNGQISAAAGEKALALLEKYVRVVVADEHERRLQALEHGRAQIGQRQPRGTLPAAPSTPTAFAVDDLL